MNYIKDGVYPIIEQQIRANHASVCFPAQMEPHHVADFGYLPVEVVTPAYNPATEKATEGAPVLINGTWQQTWAVSLKPVLPITVSPRQIRQALTAAGLRTSVENAVAAGNQDMKDWWEFAAVFEENHPVVIGMVTALGKTEAELHDVFVLAASL